MFGTDYRFVPEHLRPTLLAAHDRHCDAAKMLRQIEEGILEVYDQYRRDERWDGWQAKGGECRCMQLLLEARKRLMNRMFHQTEETYHRFSEINDTLLDLSRKTCKKIVVLYEAWLKDEEEEEWRNDCQVCGRIFAEGWEEAETSTGDDNADATGSKYDRMMAIIEEVGERDLLFIEFSGSPDYTLGDEWNWKYEVQSSLLFSYGGAKPYGDFVMCRAFQHLYSESLYSHQDILRIKMFWADVALTHQRIVTPQGKLL